MTDAVRVGPEGETPVNPYSLLEAVNNSSDTAHTAWLIFLAIMAYFMIAVAGVTHKDLLLETPVALPIMQVSIQQSLFFQFAPVILVLFHLGVVTQLVLLARKTLEFDYAVRTLELTDRRNHPLRLELHNFFFVQAIAGPHRSAVMSTFLHGMSWLTLVVVPVVILLYFQISYLPYHDVDVTWTHRICLLLDIAMLVLIGIFLLRAETSFFAAFWRTTVSNPVSFLVTVGVLLVLTFFSFFVATVPGEALDRVTQTMTRADRRADTGRDARASAGFALPFFKGRADGTLFGRFHRNLVVSDTDLTSRREAAREAASPEDITISLRGRDLRYATLDRSDLRRADLTGADLEGASLVGADLTGARLQCVDLNELILSEDHEKAKCARAPGANFTRARLAGARMAGIDVRGARFEEAGLEGAELAYAMATGANFASARMERADLTGGVQLQGANMLIAQLQGADLFGAIMQGADLSSAALQGAVLAHAQLQGAILRDADLEGADMSSAYLQRTDLTGARIRAADLRFSAVWQTSPPARDSLALADLSGIMLRATDPEDAKVMRERIERIGNERVRRQVLEAVEPILNAGESAKWGGAPERQAWQGLITASQAAQQEGYGKELTDHLLGLMCKSRYGNGSVASGIARRALGAQFRGSLAAVYERLRSRDCPASASLPPRVLQRLAAAVDSATGK